MTLMHGVRKLIQFSQSQKPLEQRGFFIFRYCVIAVLLGILFLNKRSDFIAGF